MFRYGIRWLYFTALATTSTFGTAPAFASADTLTGIKNVTVEIPSFSNYETTTARKTGDPFKDLNWSRTVIRDKVTKIVDQKLSEIKIGSTKSDFRLSVIAPSRKAESITISLILEQFVSLPQSPNSKLPVKLWESTVSTKPNEIASTVSTLMDKFCLSYLKANLNGAAMTGSASTKVSPSNHNLEQKDTTTNAAEEKIVLNNDGCKASNNGNYDLAIRKFEEALKLDPTFEKARENLCLAHINYSNKILATTDRTKALQHLHKAYYLNKTNPNTIANLDVVIRKIGKDPRNFETRVELGDQSRQSGDFIGAIVEYSEALKIKDDAGVHVKLGDSYRVRDKVDDAIKEYQAAVGLKDSAEIQVRLGQVLLAKGELKSALAAFEKAIELKPTDEDCIDALLAFWEESLKQNPTNPENHIGLGRGFELKGDFGQAKAEYVVAIGLSKGGNPTAQKLLDSLERSKEERVNLLVSDGLKRQQEKNYVGAIELYQQALRLQPEDSQKSLVLFNLASAQYTHEDYSSALDSYKESLEANRNQTDALYFIAVIEEHSGKGALAQESYQKYVAQAPHGKYEKSANERIAALKRDISSTRKIKSEAEIVREQAEQFATKAPEPLMPSTSLKKKSEPSKAPAPQKSNLYKPPEMIVVKPSVQPVVDQKTEQQLNAYAAYFAEQIAINTHGKVLAFAEGVNSKEYSSKQLTYFGNLRCDLELLHNGSIAKLNVSPTNLSPHSSLTAVGGRWKTLSKPLLVGYEEVAYQSLKGLAPFQALPVGVDRVKIRFDCNPCTAGYENGEVWLIHSGKVYSGEYMSEAVRAAKAATALSKQEQKLPAQQTPPIKTQSKLAVSNSVVNTKTEKPIDYGPYIAQVGRQIKRNWNPPKNSDSLVAIVGCSIDSQGRISNGKLISESGNKQFDQLALAAIITLGKVQPLPPGAPSSIDTEFTLDYDVYKGENNKAEQSIAPVETPAGKTSASIQPDPINFAAYIAYLTGAIERTWYATNAVVKKAIESELRSQPKNNYITGIEGEGEAQFQCMFDISSNGAVSHVQEADYDLGQNPFANDNKLRLNTALEAIKNSSPFRQFGLYPSLGSVKVARFFIELRDSKVEVSLVPKDGRQNLEAQLESMWKPSGSCPRGFAALTFDPSQKSNQVSVYNSSFNEAFDDSVKALMNQVKGCSWDVPEGSNWHITFRSNGDVTVDTPRSWGSDAYMANLQRKIKRNWNPSKEDKTKCVQAFFKVHYDGKLTNLKLEKSSGSDVTDSTGLEAIRTASPFPQLPEGAPDDIDIRFTLGHGDASSNQSDQSGKDESAVAAITLNNEGVRALSDKKFKLAIEKLEESLKLNPTYELARKNLSIAYNNIGLDIILTNPSEAVSNFKKAVQIDPTNKVSNDNLIQANEELAIQTTISEFFCAWQNGDLVGINAVVSDSQKDKVAELYKDAEEVRKASQRMLWPPSLEFSRSSQPSSSTTKSCSVQGLLGRDRDYMRAPIGIGPIKRWKVTIFLVKEGGKWKVDTIDWAGSKEPNVKEPDTTSKPSFFGDGDFISKPVYIRPAPDEARGRGVFRTF